ncbi:MAG: ATP synthase F1 subunit gamma [Armatimonadetes bacterium]|nr:ATP synthase F1 subunit gamma [Armatimonadota bacterium]
MASMRDIRRRIRVVKNIQQITNAMKMVAAARLRRAQDRAETARPYADKMFFMLESLSRAAQQVEHPLLEVRPEERIAVVVIGAERGLAGSYNANIMRRTTELLKGRDPEAVKLITFGRKATTFFRRRPYEIVMSSSLPATNIQFAEVRAAAAKVRELFEAREVDAVYLVYAKFINAAVQRPTALKLLPIAPPKAEEEAGPAEYIFEPGPDELLGRLLPKYVDTQVFRSAVEAVASEHGARMTAMTSATNNAGEVIDSLTLSYNKARQAAITKELLEIVSGAEALR